MLIGTDIRRYINYSFAFVDTSINFNYIQTNKPYNITWVQCTQKVIINPVGSKHYCLLPVFLWYQYIWATYICWYRSSWHTTARCTTYSESIDIGGAMFITPPTLTTINQHYISTIYIISYTFKLLNYYTN